MVCLDNSSHYLSIVVYCNFLAYFFICLPQYSKISSLVASLNFSVLALTAYTALAPNYVPGSTLPLFMLNASFLVLFFLLADAVGTIVFVFAAFVFFGPILLVTREHIQSFTEHQFGFAVGDFALGLIGVGLFVLTAYLYAAASRNRVFEFVLVSVVYAFLCAIGVRFLYIQTTRSESLSAEYCCGRDYPDAQCPLIFNWLFLLFWIVLGGFRVVCIYMFAPCTGLSNPESSDKPKPQPRVKKPHRQIANAEEYQPVSQSDRPDEFY